MQISFLNYKSLVTYFALNKQPHVNVHFDKNQLLLGH